MGRPGRRVGVGFLLASLALGTSALASQELAPGLKVSYDNGKIAVTAKDRSVREILTSVAQKAGFTLEGADLLPEERVTVVLTPGPAFREIPALLGLAPKLNYVVVYGDTADKRHQVVKVALFPREGGKDGPMVVGSGLPGGATNTPYTPPPPPVALPPPPTGAPVYQPPETVPVYIPPETPPVYIPPDSPPQYIPADGPPQYIPPAPPPPGGDPNQVPQKPNPPPDEEPQ